MVETAHSHLGHPPVAHRRRQAIGDLSQIPVRSGFRTVGAEARQDLYIPASEDRRDTAVAAVASRCSWATHEAPATPNNAGER